jgi:hypothetical protein
VAGASLCRTANNLDWKIETRMSRPKRQIGSSIEIEGFRLNWRLHREQQFFAEGWQGASIHVQNERDAHRDLYLEYPLVPSQKQARSRVDFTQVQIHAKKVEAHIRQAMAAGWDPDSRGKKPFVFVVPEPPS